MGKIFYIMGKSASGKDKIYSILLADQELNLRKMVLYTTRPVREGEENGKQYFEEASQEWMDNYMKTRTAPLVRK